MSNVIAPRILCVDHDGAIGSELPKWLTRNGFHAMNAVTASDALVSATGDPPDMLLVSGNLGGSIWGSDLCRELLKLSAFVGVIVLGGRPTASERVVALDAGADDCIPAPFDAAELCARIRAVLRRRHLSPIAKLPSAIQNPTTLAWGPLTLRPLDQVVAVEGVGRDLTRSQTRILARLIHASGRLVSSEDLWTDFAVSRRPNLGNIRVHVHALRRRLDPYGNLIETWPGRGYSLRAVTAAAGSDAP